MTTYAAARSSIHTGDILVFKGRSLFGLLIRWATKSPAAHVALARWDLGRLMVYQSMEGHGVECIPASKQVDKADTVWVLRRPVQDDLLLGQAMVALGDKYSWASILGIAWRVILGRLNLKGGGKLDIGKGAYICSEYVYACLYAAGYDVPWDGLGFIAPSDFLQDPGLAWVATIEPS